MFPVGGSDGKKPLVARAEGGAGFKDATADEAQVRAMWERFPDANIAIATGVESGVVVLDVDAKPRKDGRPTLEALEARHGALPPTLVVRTPSGGFHIYFRAVPGLGCTTNGLGLGLDTRAEGGYVVAPPSESAGGRYEEVTEHPPAEMPAWLLALWPRAGVGKARTVAPVPPYDGPVDLAELRRLLSELRVAKSRATDAGEVARHELLRRVLEGEALAPLGQRTRALLSITGMMARKFPAGMPAAAAVELLRPSIAAMPMDEGDPKHEREVDHWLVKARARYDAAMRARVSADAEAAAMRERRDKLRALFLAESGINASEIPVEKLEAADWRECLEINPKTGAVVDTPSNLRLILTCDDALCGHVKWDELRRRLRVGGAFADVPSSVVSIEVRTWLHRAHKLKCQIGDVEGQLLAVAMLPRNRVNPVAEYLQALEWDGVPRVGSWLERYCGAVTTQGGIDVAEHVARVGWKWLVSAVARALDPGCQVDTMLILEGPQGIKKTSCFRILGGAWYRAAALDVTDRDTKMQVGTAWICEFGELDGIGRVEAARLKNFLTTTVDAYRVPYGRDTEDFPRRCVFVGTTNDAEYLQDPTGLRRFWPVTVTRVDAQALEQDRDQLWAEAVQVYRQHAAWCESHPGASPDASPHRWWLVDDECAIAESVADARSVNDSLAAKVAAWWFKVPPAGRPAHVGAYHVAEQALELDAARVNRAVLMRVGTALRRLGFTKLQVRVGGAREWVYAPSDELRTMAQVAGRLGTGPRAVR